MTIQLSGAQVWAAIEKEIFAVLGMVTAQQQARTVGIVYVVRERKLYLSSRKGSWKGRHIAANPHVSLTIPIAKRIPLLPWIKIPAATITFSGTARLLDPAAADPALLQALFRTAAQDPQIVAATEIIEVTPQKEFITYGVGVPLLAMRDPARARGRAPVHAA